MPFGVRFSQNVRAIRISAHNSGRKIIASTFDELISCVFSDTWDRYSSSKAAIETMPRRPAAIRVEKN